MSKAMPQEEFVSFDPQDDSAGAVSTTAAVPAYLLSSERAAMFRTIALLLEAGLELDNAVRIYVTEVKARGTPNLKNNADRIVEFFAKTKAACAAHGGADDDVLARSSEIAEIAERCFYKNYVSLGEAVLLRSLAFNANMPTVLKSIADLIKFQDGAPGGKTKTQGRTE